MFWLKKLFIISVLLVLSISCNQKQPAQSIAETDSESVKISEIKLDPAITKTKDLSPVETPEYKQAMITFISGEVFRHVDGEWVYAEIGDFLEANDSIKVESGSFCEIQFSDRAVIRVEEDTELALNTVNLNPNGAKIGIELIAGTVISKVQKLAENDRYNVKTQSTACGVRGTEFSVKVEPGGDTVLAVKKGAVAILPSELVVEDLVERAGKSGDVVAEVLEKIETAAFVVSANEEISLTEESFEKTRETVKEITEIIEIIEAMEDDTELVKEVPSEIVEALTAVSKIVTENVVEAVAPVEELSDFNIAKLESTEDMRMINIPVAEVPSTEDTDKTDKNETVEPQKKISLHKFSLKIIPANAEIILNSKIVGKGSFSGIFEEGEILDFKFVSNNFKSRSTSFVVSEETSRQYTISLEKTKVEPEKKDAPPVKEEQIDNSQAVEGGSSTVTVEEKAVEIKEDSVKKDTIVEEVSMDKNPLQGTSEDKKLIDVSISIEPSDSLLVVNGEKVRSNIFTGEFPEGTSLTIKGTRNGFADKTMLLNVGEQVTDSVSISLEPRPVESVLSVSESKLVGSVITGGNLIYTSDSKGLISASTPDGRSAWSYASANKSVENSYPVFSNNRIYFSGSSELVILNALNGKVIDREALDKNSAHIFGRRLVPFGSQSLFPSNDEIRVLNSSSGDLIRTISLPGNGSRMTPAVWKNKILSVDQNGTLSIINPDNGVVEKEITTSGSQPIALSITIKNNLAVFSGRKGNVVCIDLDAGKVLWETQLVSGGTKVQVYSDIVSSNTGVYIYTKGTIHALNLNTGKNLFENISGVSSPPGVINNQLVFGDNNNNLVFINAKNGRLDKILNLDDTVSARPAKLGSLIAAGTLGGKLVVINPAGIQ